MLENIGKIYMWYYINIYIYIYIYIYNSPLQPQLSWQDLLSEQRTKILSTYLYSESNNGWSRSLLSTRCLPRLSIRRRLLLVAEAERRLARHVSVIATLVYPRGLTGPGTSPRPSRVCHRDTRLPARTHWPWNVTCLSSRHSRPPARTHWSWNVTSPVTCLSSRHSRPPARTHWPWNVTAMFSGKK